MLYRFLPRLAPHLPPLLGENPRKVLGPRRPAKHTLWVVMAGLITQHGALAGGVGAGGVAGVVTPRHHMAFQGGLEGRGGVASRHVGIEPTGPAVFMRSSARRH